MDASLERLETVERFVMGEPQTFTLYRYGLPGVDVIVWVDEDNRVCLGDVPAQHAAYVREGYEALRQSRRDRFAPLAAGLRGDASRRTSWCRCATA